MSRNRRLPTGKQSTQLAKLADFAKELSKGSEGSCASATEQEGDDMLTYHRTSLLTSQAQTIVNTVNTVGVMGKGLAAALKKQHPAMFEAYKRICAQHLLDVGKLWLWQGAGQWVLNFPTKKHWRHPSKLEYVELGLQKFVKTFEAKGIREIAFPRLGCGNGGLDWDEVRPLMHKYLSDLPIRVYIHDYEAEMPIPEHKESRLSH